MTENKFEIGDLVRRSDDFFYDLGIVININPKFKNNPYQIKWFGEKANNCLWYSEFGLEINEIKKVG